MSSEREHSEEGSDWDYVRWRGAVKRAIKGKRGQAFLSDLVEALDALPEQRLTSHKLKDHNGYCAIGAVFAKRGIDPSPIDPGDHDGVASRLGISESLAREIASVNDEGGPSGETRRQRWARMREWALKNIATETG